MLDEHTPVSRKLRAHPCAAGAASKSIFSMEFVELSSIFVLASIIFGLRLDASRNFMQKSLEFIELSHFFEQFRGFRSRPSRQGLDFWKAEWELEKKRECTFTCLLNKGLQTTLLLNIKAPAGDDREFVPQERLTDIMLCFEKTARR